MHLYPQSTFCSHTAVLHACLALLETTRTTHKCTAFNSKLALTIYLPQQIYRYTHCDYGITFSSVANTFSVQERNIQF